MAHPVRNCINLGGVQRVSGSRRRSVPQDEPPTGTPQFAGRDRSMGSHKLCPDGFPVKVPRPGTGALAYFGNIARSGSVRQGSPREPRQSSLLLDTCKGSHVRRRCHGPPHRRTSVPGAAPDHSLRGLMSLRNVRMGREWMTNLADRLGLLLSDVQAPVQQSPPPQETLLHDVLDHGRMVDRLPRS